MLELDWVNQHKMKDGSLPPIAYVHGELFGANGLETTPDNPRGTRSKSIENRCKGKGEWNVYDVVCVDGTVKLSQPLPSALPAGSLQVTTLRFEPFRAESTEGGAPNPAYDDVQVNGVEPAQVEVPVVGHNGREGPVVVVASVLVVELVGRDRFQNVLNQGTPGMLHVWEGEVDEAKRWDASGVDLQNLFLGMGVKVTHSKLTRRLSARFQTQRKKNKKFTDFSLL